METTTSYQQLSDDELAEALAGLARDERATSLELVRTLMEFDGRQLYLREGYASLFSYCTQILGLEDGAAYNRIEVARLARRCPVVLEALAAGEVTLSSLRVLAPHVTVDNVEALLAAARGRSRREVEAQVALLRSRSASPAPTRIVAVPPARHAPAAVSGPLDCTACSALPEGAVAGEHTGAAPASPSTENGVTTTATPETSHVDYRLHVTISADTYAALQRAQALLRHAIPSGDAALVLRRALSLLVDHLERRRIAATDHPRKSRHPAPSPSSRRLPAAVRRAVWRRDGGRCAFVGRKGRCTERAWLEFHHVQPFARGGAATVNNIELRCRAHNAHEASLVFGGTRRRKMRRRRAP